MQGGGVVWVVGEEGGYTGGGGLSMAQSDKYRGGRR